MLFRSRAWNSYIDVTNWGLNGFRGVTCPANVTIYELDVSLAVTFSTSWFCGTATRKCKKVQDATPILDFGLQGVAPNGNWNTGIVIDGTAGQFTGMKLEGTGWSNDGGPGGFLAYGSMNFLGTEVYTYQVTITDQNQASSGYW